MSYTLRQVGMRYDVASVLSDVSIEFGGSQLATIVGPNGAGKSTLLGIMAGLKPGYSGECLYERRDVRRWPRAEFARGVSFVPQTLRIEFPFTAEQVVWMGRTPYGDGLFESPDDRRPVEEAMATTDTLPFRARDFRSLSGGERQRVILASALAQTPRVLLLDEPTTFLDLKHQISIYRLLRDLARSGLLVIAVTHDLNLAATYSDRIVMLHEGRVVADATPEAALDPSRIREVFGVESQMRRDPDGRPWIWYGA